MNVTGHNKAEENAMAICEAITEGAATKSNWPSEYMETRVPKPRPTKQFYALDMDGQTVCTSEQPPTALARQLKNLGHDVEVRFVTITDDDRNKEDEKRRERQWQTQIYKPTPVRRQR
jgi:hypothetical protein